MLGHIACCQTACQHAAKTELVSWHQVTPRFRSCIESQSGQHLDWYQCERLGCRLSYSADAAADTDMLQGHEPGARERIEGGFLFDKAIDKSSEGVTALAAMALRLPTRVLIRCQSGQLPLCEYQSRACPLMLCVAAGAAAFAQCYVPTRSSAHTLACLPRKFICSPAASCVSL